MITFEDFKKIDLRIGKIETAERVENSEKLIKLSVNLGEEVRQIVAGIGKKYAPEELVGKNIVVVVNLESRALMGIESHGMLLAASSEEGPILITVDGETSSGAKVG